MKPTIIATVLLICLSFVSSGQVPGTFSYQGILMQNDGITPIADGAHSIVFNFYTTNSGGSALFSRTISVTTTKGLYTCIIGGGAAPNAPFIATEKNQLGSQQIFIGIALDGGSELLPRAQLTTGAYSIRSESITNTVNPTGGGVSFWGTNNTLSSDAGLFWDNNNHYLGIGTSTPAGYLDVKGGAGNLRIFDYALQFTRPATNYIHATSAGGQFYFTVNGNADTNAAMVIKAGGEVGIGTTAPGTPLHLKGNGNLLRLEGANHSYIEFYPDGPTTRKAWFGFGSSTDDNFRIVNQAPSGGNIVLETTSGGIGINTATPGLDIEIDQQLDFRGLRFRAPGGNHGNYWDVGKGNVNDNFQFWFNGSTKGFINNSDGSYNTSSDARLKENIEEITNILPRILKLSPKTYYFKSDPSKERSIGLIAQEVLPLFPDAVELESTGYYSLSTSDFGILSIQGIKELHQIIAVQQAQIEDLKSCNKNLEQRVLAIEGSLDKNSASMPYQASKSGKP